MSRSADCWAITQLNPLKPRHHLCGPHPPAQIHSPGNAQNVMKALGQGQPPHLGNLPGKQLPLMPQPIHIDLKSNA